MSDNRYDVIVVGAGAAGAPLAARLSADPARSVLLVEAGPDMAAAGDYPAELLDAGSLSAAMPGHPNNWSFHADLTPELPYTVARGKILGGSTAINGTYFVRARRQDFDEWVSLGNTEWSYEKCLPYYRMQERDLLYGDSELHGGSGPIAVYREVDNPHPLTQAFYQACRELGFVAEPDKNDQAAPGYGPLPVNAVDGVRMNTGMAYLEQARQRPNLTIRGNTLARRITFAGTRATGLEVDTDGRIESIEAAEIVICAGAIKSPHLLALSGIGPRAELAAVGIDLVCDLPGVGKQFADHPDIAIGWRPRGRMVAPIGGRIFEGVLNFTATGSAHRGDLQILPMLRSMSEVLGIAAGRDVRGYLRVLRRAKATVSALAGVSLRRFAEQVAHRHDLVMAVAVQHAQARGDITVVSSDPDVQPRIEYHYLDNAADRDRMRQGIRTTVRLLRSQAFAAIFDRLTELDDTILADDAALDRWMLTHLGTSIHACGTCRMGSDPATGAVVDQWGRVHGVSGVRVADTSILPTTPSVGPAATAILIGERIAEFMINPAGSSAS